MKHIIHRAEYLNTLIQWKDHQLIKVVTGMRRSGKSTLLTTIYRDYLLSVGVKKEQIIIIDLESIDNEHLYTYRALYDHIKTRLIKNKKNYVIIDEVQNAESFQKAVDSLYVLENVDLYITGSNAKVLSGELATLLSGRYITIEMLPLSFKEFKDGQSTTKSNQDLYLDYVRYGGFPYIHELNLHDKNIHDYLEGIYNTILKKDIIARHRISDVMVLEDVIKFVFDNIGNILSSHKISQTLTSGGRRVYPQTVEAFLSYLIDSFVVYKVGRYDTKGKTYLKSLEKYYVADIGLRNYLLGFRNMDRGHILENIVYLELRRRGYKIFIGKYEDHEIDFVIQNQRETMYIQVAETIASKETLQRELTSLRLMKDLHPRLILTMDRDLNTSYDGINVVNVLDWLLNK
jgi:uncharacterized protein